MLNAESKASNIQINYPCNQSLIWTLMGPITVSIVLVLLLWTLYQLIYSENWTLHCTCVRKEFNWFVFDRTIHKAGLPLLQHFWSSLGHSKGLNASLFFLPSSSEHWSTVGFLLKLIQNGYLTVNCLWTHLLHWQTFHRQFSTAIQFWSVAE